jgi:hypothetical protein
MSSFHHFSGEIPPTWSQVGTRLGGPGFNLGASVDATEHRLEAYATMGFRTVERYLRAILVSDGREPTAATRRRKVAWLPACVLVRQSRSETHAKNVTIPAGEQDNSGGSKQFSTHLSGIEASFVLKLSTMNILGGSRKFAAL